MKSDQKGSSGSPSTACCASFEGDDVFVIHRHDMNQEWISLGGEHLNYGNPLEKTLLWTDHKIWFQVRGKAMDRGDKVTVDGVDLYVCESGGINVAEGREMHYLHNA